MLLKFEQFSGTNKKGTSTVSEELSNLDGDFDKDALTILYSELDNDELLTSFCRDLYKAYLKDTGREGRIIIRFEEFYFYRLINTNDRIPEKAKRSANWPTF